MSVNIENMSFEEAMKRLDEITEELSREGVSLDRSLALYEEGVALVALGRLDASLFAHRW